MTSVEENMEESMTVVVYSPESDEVYLSRVLGDEEIMDADIFANQVADMFGVEVAESNGYIPNCSGDIRVEFRPDSDNPTRIWSGKSYYFAQE